VPVHDDRKIFEFLVLEAFQAGLSWRTILYKRENFRKAFAGFDYRKVARFGRREVAPCSRMRALSATARRSFAWIAGMKNLTLPRPSPERQQRQPRQAGT
jgi:3-methyladenine DNA glycosylase Tag